MISPALIAWSAGLLEDAISGVNAVRNSVPRTGFPLPPPIVVYDAVSDNEVARRAPPEPTPLEWVLYVECGENVVLPGSPNVDDRHAESLVVVRLAGATAQSNDAGTLASAHLLMRCVQHCFFEAFRAVQAGSGRLVFDQQHFSFPERIQVRTVRPEPGSGRIDMYAIVPFTYIDYWA